MSSRPFLLLCTTGLFAIFSSSISKSPVLPLFAAHLGADPAGIGFIAAISAFAGVAFSIPAGLLADRVGNQRLLLAAAVVFASAPLGYFLVNDTWQLALVRLYHGFATAIFIPVAMAMVSSLSASQRGENMGWFSTATLAGRFMAPAIGGAILGHFALNSSLSYQMVYASSGVTGAIALLIALLLPAPAEKNPTRPAWAESFRAFKTVAMHPEILITCLFEAAILFAYGTFETFLPLYAISNGLSATEAGVFLASQIIVLALTKPSMGKFSDAHGRRPQIFAGGLLGAVCFVGLSIFHSFFALLCLSIAFGLSLSIVTSASSAYIADLSSREARGAAMGLLGAIMDIGHTAGPLVSGLVAAAFGYSRSFLGAAIVLLIVALIFVCYTKGNRLSPCPASA